MPDGVRVAAFALCCVGFALLALTQERHWRDATGRPMPGPVARGRARAAAALALAFALALSIAADGPGFGVLLWFACLSTAAIAVALALAWRPRALGALAGCLDRPRARPRAGR